MAARRHRDIERVYTTRQFVAKLRRLADALETGKPFTIQVAGEPIRVPAGAEFNVEHERGADGEEVEFQLKWSAEDASVAARRAARRGSTRRESKPR